MKRTLNSDDSMPMDSSPECQYSGDGFSTGHYLVRWCHWWVRDGFRHLVVSGCYVRTVEASLGLG